MKPSWLREGVEKVADEVRGHISKQDIIREGITKLLEHYYGDCGMTHSSVASAIMEYEDRLSVVIKVDRELPSEYTKDGNMKYAGWMAIDMLNAGYGAFESLIEDKDEDK